MKIKPLLTVAAVPVLLNAPTESASVPITKRRSATAQNKTKLRGSLSSNAQIPRAKSEPKAQNAQNATDQFAPDTIGDIDRISSILGNRTKITEPKSVEDTSCTSLAAGKNGLSSTALNDALQCARTSLTTAVSQIYSSASTYVVVANNMLSTSLPYNAAVAYSKASVLQYTVKELGQKDAIDKPTTNDNPTNTVDKVGASAGQQSGIAAAIAGGAAVGVTNGPIQSLAKSPFIAKAVQLFIESGDHQAVKKLSSSIGVKENDLAPVLTDVEQVKQYPFHTDEKWEDITLPNELGTVVKKLNSGHNLKVLFAHDDKNAEISKPLNSLESMTTPASFPLPSFPPLPSLPPLPRRTIAPTSPATEARKLPDLNSLKALGEAFVQLIDLSPTFRHHFYQHMALKNDPDYTIRVRLDPGKSGMLAYTTLQASTLTVFPYNKGKAEFRFSLEDFKAAFIHEFAHDVQPGISSDVEGKTFLKHDIGWSHDREQTAFMGGVINEHNHFLTIAKDQGLGGFGSLPRLVKDIDSDDYCEDLILKQPEWKTLPAASVLKKANRAIENQNSNLALNIFSKLSTSEKTQIHMYDAQFGHEDENSHFQTYDTAELVLQQMLLKVDSVDWFATNSTATNSTATNSTAIDKKTRETMGNFLNLLAEKAPTPEDQKSWTATINGAFNYLSMDPQLEIPNYKYADKAPDTLSTYSFIEVKGDSAESNQKPSDSKQKPLIGVIAAMSVIIAALTAYIAAKASRANQTQGTAAVEMTPATIGDVPDVPATPPAQFGPLTQTAQPQAGTAVNTSSVADRGLLPV
jgi:hypothetical protein